MVREGYGTSGEGNGTTVGHLKVGTGEVLPLLARDPNYSSVPGSDAEPRLSELGSDDAPRARTHTTAPILCTGRMRSNTSRAMGARAWAARSLVVAALASLCVAGVAADVEPRDDASALGESESRLVDLRYELSVRLPKGVLPCELTPDEGAMHAVEKAVFDAINHDVAPLPRNADVRLACVCEGERCDERCADCLLYTSPSPRDS